jgi:pyruvate/oxaloacetate carboxyltransferase
MVVALTGTEFDTNIDVRRIRPAAYILKQIIDETPEYSGLIGPLQVSTDVLTYQIPGGMISNLRAQLKQMGAENRIEEILAEVPRVRQELGYPPLVTPMSQIVGTQAAFNVILGERYKNISTEVANYIRGHYGRPAGTIDPALAERVLKGEKPVTGRPGDGLAPGLPAAREAVAPYGGDEFDALSYALFPKETISLLEARQK